MCDNFRFLEAVSSRPMEVVVPLQREQKTRTREFNAIDYVHKFFAAACAGTTLCKAYKMKIRTDTSWLLLCWTCTVGINRRMAWELTMIWQSLDIEGVGTMVKDLDLVGLAEPQSLRWPCQMGFYLPVWELITANQLHDFMILRWARYSELIDTKKLQLMMQHYVD